MKESPPTKTALDILQENSTNNIVTFSKSLDNLLEGGIPTKLITEIVGPPGSGKTQLCLQLCTSVQLPKEFGGLDGKALYIDTNSGFSKNRLTEIAEGVVKQCEYLSKKYKITLDLNVEKILNGVKYIKISLFLELLALGNLLPELNDVKLIIIDTISKPLKQCHLEYYKRTKVLYTFLGKLQELAQKYNFAIVLTNDITTKFTKDRVAFIGSALGDSFAHRVNIKLRVQRIDDIEFLAILEKTNSKVSGTVKFKVTKAGLRDVE